MKVTRKIKRPKQFTYDEAFKRAKEDNSIVIISEFSKDKYKVETIDHQERIKFYGPAINNWQNCTFILASELVGAWNIEKDGIVETEIVEI